MTRQDIVTRQEEYIRQIKILNDNIWENKVARPEIDQWLANFGDNSRTGALRRLYALFLLSQFTYFGEREIRQLLRCVYLELFRAPIISEIRTALGNTRNVERIDRRFLIELGKTRFTSIGNVSESSAMLLCPFRQVNELPTNLFCDGLALAKERRGARVLAHPRATRYVFVDDICGSGHQVVEYASCHLAELKRLNPAAELHYYVLLGTAEGLKYVQDSRLFTRVDRLYELDRSFRCFGSSSRYFTSLDKKIAKDDVFQMCHDYGTKICPAHPLGYSNSQLLLGFHHNTPDNTLPIFWCDGSHGCSWRPVFTRYSKIIG